MIKIIMIFLPGPAFNCSSQSVPELTFSCHCAKTDRTKSHSAPPSSSFSFRRTRLHSLALAGISISANQIRLPNYCGKASAPFSIPRWTGAKNPFLFIGQLRGDCERGWVRKCSAETTTSVTIATQNSSYFSSHLTANLGNSQTEFDSWRRLFCALRVPCVCLDGICSWIPILRSVLFCWFSL